MSINSTPPINTKEGQITAAAMALHDSIISPVNFIKYSPKSDYYGKIIIPLKGNLPKIDSTFPKEFGKNTTLFYTYPLLNKFFLENKFSPVTSGISAGIISGFMHGAFFNSPYSLKPDLLKGMKGSVHWGTFFGTLEKLQQKKTSSVAQTLTNGALAGSVSKLAEDFFSHAARPKEPFHVAKSAARGSYQGMVLTAIFALVNKVFEK